VDGLQLRVAVGHVQQAHEAFALAQRRQVVQALFGRGGVGVFVAGQAHAGHRSGGQDLHEFALAQAHDK
jgi:hypothetical protein